uniref:Uncharacterized protein n=1 Tax=Rhabditophanes sp. KR3021 TaxID=114890 RepID=A0AC35TFU7_9BILA
MASSSNIINTTTTTNDASNVSKTNNLTEKLKNLNDPVIDTTSQENTLITCSSLGCGTAAEFLKETATKTKQSFMGIPEDADDYAYGDK